MPHRARVRGSAGPSMAGGQGWGGEDTQGAGGTGTRYVQRQRLPPGEPARWLPPRPRGGAAPSRFSQLLPTPPTAGRGREGATLLRGWGGGVTGTSWAPCECVGRSPGLQCSSYTRTFQAAGSGHVRAHLQPEIAHLAKELISPQRLCSVHLFIHSFIHCFIHSRNSY